jgi:enamine deaminase RidA (YjgF/YER057c/UK114 family)
MSETIIPETGVPPVAPRSAPIERLAGQALGRSAGSAFGPMVFIATVAHDRQANLETQARETLARLNEQLAALGSDKTLLLSVTVYLADMADKARFDAIWIEWIGAEPSHWPQRACVGAALAGETRVEISVVAVRAAAVEVGRSRRHSRA